jgi:small glutamine-rich tetratricopeptide repeat-containing protein alpha
VAVDTGSSLSLFLSLSPLSLSLSLSSLYTPIDHHSSWQTHARSNSSITCKYTQIIRTKEYSIDFLRVSSSDGTVKEDDKESLEVAIQCIAESFGVDPDDASNSIAPASLLSLLDVYLKTKARAAPAPAAPAGPSTEDKAKAEELKAKGNTLMSQKLYDSAIEQYSDAIKLAPSPVYYSNRAAAWGGLGEHAKAVTDAQKALELDPKFSKAYSRLG